MPDELKNRAQKYIDNLDGIITELKNSNAVNLARDYFNDAKYYFDKEDYVSSIVCSTYAEGIIDGLTREGILNVSWKPPLEKPTVVVAGTWDVIHPGHINLLEIASKLGDLIVIVARDKNVQKAKGHPPLLSEQQRLMVISALKPVKKAILGNESGDPVKTVADINPDVFVLGPDQPYAEQLLQDKLTNYGAKTRVIKIKQKFEAPGLITSSSKIIERARQMSSSNNTILNNT